jgi:hypothetical protein
MGRIILTETEIEWDFWEPLNEQWEDKPLYRHKPTGAFAYKLGACLLLLTAEEAAEILAHYQAKRSADTEMLAPGIKDWLKEVEGV